MVGQTNPLRQQMINMMYLVLLALLALNVSAEILEAFENIGKGISESIYSVEKKNGTTMEQFDAQMKNDEERTKPYFIKAQKANELANDLFNYVNNLENKIVRMSGGYAFEDGDSTLEDKKNLDIPSQVLVKQKKGEELQEKINTTRVEMAGLLQGIEGFDYELFESQLTLRAEDPEGDGQGRDWAQFTFEGVPSIAAVTLLKKIKNDIRNTQASVLDRLLSSIGADEISFDVLIPVVKAKKSSVAVGEKYEAEIFLSAYSSTQNPQIVVGERDLEVANGKGKFVAEASTPGTVKKDVVIKVKNPTTGKITEYTEVLEYDVFKAPAIISADAMTVLYTGLDNPISVSVPGYKPEEVSASIKGGTLKGSGSGKYMARVSSGREAVISVSVKTPGGGSKHVGSQTFRIKPVPKPIAYYGNKASGEISPGELQAIPFIVARMGEGFAFEGIKYTVEKFKFIFNPRNGNAQFAEGRGPRITSQMKAYMGNPQKGDMIIVTDIDVKGPDGIKRLPNGITLTVE